MCVSNFVRLSRSIPEIQHCSEIQYGGRPLSWIPNISNFEVNPQHRCIVLFPCVKFRENRSIRPEIQYFFRNTIWRSAAIFSSPQCKFRGKLQNRSYLLLVCVKLLENLSIGSRITKSHMAAGRHLGFLKCTLFVR
jgi:hypothetical protein